MLEWIRVDQKGKPVKARCLKDVKALSMKSKEINVIQAIRTLLQVIEESRRRIGPEEKKNHPFHLQFLIIANSCHESYDSQILPPNMTSFLDQDISN